MEIIENESPEKIGYCFYHVQDMDSAAEGENLYLAYGSVDGDESSSKEVGDIIYETCMKKFKTEWNGNTNTRIKIHLPKNIIRKFKNDIELENEMYADENDDDSE